MVLADMLSENAKQDLEFLVNSFHVQSTDNKELHSIFLFKINGVSNKVVERITNGCQVKATTIFNVGIQLSEDILGEARSLEAAVHEIEVMDCNSWFGCMGRAKSENIYVVSRADHITKVLGNNIRLLVDGYSWWYKISDGTISELKAIIDGIIDMVDETRSRVKGAAASLPEYIQSKHITSMIEGRNLRAVYAAVMVGMAKDGVLNEAIVEVLTSYFTEGNEFYGLKNSPQTWPGYVCHNIQKSRHFKSRLRSAISKYTWEGVDEFTIATSAGDRDPDPDPVIVSIVKDAMDASMMEYLRNVLRPYFAVKKVHS